MNQQDLVRRIGGHMCALPAVVRYLALLLCCAVLFLGPGLFSSGYYNTANLLLGHFPWRSELPMPPRSEMMPILTDLPTAVIPAQWLATHEVRAGRLPLWNPWSAAGRPLLANNHTAVFSPHSVGYYLFEERGGLLWSAAWRLVFGGLGMWLLARRLGIAEAGAAFAGLCFAFCGPVVMWLGYPLSAVLATFPWLLLCTDTLVRAPGAQAAAALAVVLALALVAGHPETAFKVVLCATVWGGWLWVRSAPRRGATVSWTLLGGAVGALLAAAHLLPTLEYLQHSEALAIRQAPGFTKLPPVPAPGMFAWLLPNVFGHPQGEGVWLPQASYVSLSAYAGLWVPLLAVWTLVRRDAPQRIRALAVIGALAALGVYGLPPVIWLFDHAPMFRMSLNNRYLLIAVASAILLAACSIDGLRTRPPSRRTALGIAGVGILLLVIGWMLPVSVVSSVAPALYRAGVVLVAGGAVLAWRTGPWGIVLVAVVDLLTWGYRLNPVTPTVQHYPVTPFIAALQHELADDPQHRMLARGYLFPSDTPSRYGIRDAKGFDAIEVARYARYMTLAMDGGRGQVDSVPRTLRLPLYQTYAGPLLDAAAVGVVLSLAPLSEPQFIPIAQTAEVFAYRNKRVLPRARLAQSVEMLSSADAVAERLRRRGHDPAKVTLLEGDPLPWPAGGQGEVTFLLEEHDRVRLRSVANAPAVLVLADVMFPGWEATVDGEPVPIRYADLAFRAVPVPAGEHVVEFVYRPASVRIGLLLSGLGIVVAAGLGVAGGWRRAAPGETSESTL